MFRKLLGSPPEVVFLALPAIFLRSPFVDTSVEILRARLCLRRRGVEGT